VILIYRSPREMPGQTAVDTAVVYQRFCGTVNGLWPLAAVTTKQLTLCATLL
jgi:hypothetical protein